MGRNIIVFADGTGNSAAKPFKTNVWRLYQALDLQGGEQLAAFADGVGTSSFRPFAVLGLALGFGVKSRVLTLYKFLCLNYREGDHIYAFGFSRGAFIVRLLVGMIQEEGLVEFKSEEELERNAAAAYRANRAKTFPVGNIRLWVPLYRAVRNGLIWFYNYLTGSRHYSEVRPPEGHPRAAGNVAVHFLGVWDTVAAYGLPVEELTRAFDRMVWPLTFANLDLVDCVETARQAFAIDDERRTFFPLRWNETPELTEETDHSPARLRQVWFAGSHSNIGGGYPDDRLSHLPLCWMIGEAARCGLSFKQDIVADYWDYASESGRIYDSRAGFGMTYRYHPRSAGELMGGARPLIDSSVIQRLKLGNDRYAPIAVPGQIDVLTPCGDRSELNFTTKRTFTPDQLPLDYLPLPDGRRRSLIEMERDVAGVMASIAPADAEQNAEDVNLLMDTVWWRRGLYFVMLALASTLMAFPLLAGYLTKVRYNEIGSGIVGPLIGLLQGLLPGFAAPWIEAISDNSVAALAIAVLFLGCLALNRMLRNRIVDRARAVWNASERADGELLAVNRKLANRRMALAIALVCFAVAAFAIFLPDNSASLKYVPMMQQQQRLPMTEIVDSTRARDWIRDIFLVVGSIALIGWIHFRYQVPLEGNGSNNAPISLRIARFFRKSGVWQTIYSIGGKYVIPAIFLAAATFLTAAFLNKAGVQVASAAGVYCPESLGDLPRAYQKLDDAIHFQTSGPCHDTGIRLDAGVTYRLKLEVEVPWFDGQEVTDVRGFSPGDVKTERPWLYYLGNLFKRWWGQPYFKPVARIGSTGNDEYVLEPLQPERPDRGNAKFLFSVVKPKSSGELYLYVNDITFPLPGLTEWFYDNNTGTAKLTVDRVAVESFDLR